MYLREEDVRAINCVLGELLGNTDGSYYNENDRHQRFIIEQGWAYETGKSSSTFRKMHRNDSTGVAYGENLAQKLFDEQEKQKKKSDLEFDALKKDRQRYWIATAIGIATLLVSIATLLVSLVKCD